MMRIWAGSVMLALAATIATISAGPASAQEDLLVGMLFPLTGPGASIGTEMKNGVELAIEHINARGGINGRKVRAVVEDSQGKPDQAVIGFNRMVDLNKVPVVQVAYSSVALAIAPLSARRRVVVVNPGAQSDKLGNASPYLFNTIPLIQDEAPALSKFAFSRVGKTAVTIYENAAAGHDGNNDFKRTFEALGGKVLAEEPVEFGQTNFRPVLAKVMSLKPDMVYIALTQGFSVLADQVAQINGFPVAVGHTFSNPFFGYPSTVGWYNSAIRSTAPPELLAELNARFGTTRLGNFAHEYYNSSNIIFAAMKKVIDDGKEVSGENIRQAIFDIGTFDSPVAKITFAGSNTAKRPVDILRNGEKAQEKVDFVTD
jgi:branched-chain amino acid transport system substrate-binding protein